MRWCFIQRTISDIGPKFQPLEDTIREKLIPAIVGRTVSNIERRILALPIRMGGLGIQNPVQTAKYEFETSKQITKYLSIIICKQEQNLVNYHPDIIKNEITKLNAVKDNRLKNEFKVIQELVSDDVRRSLNLATEKGSGAWLSALPLQSLGYVLNKQEFRDGIYLRYGRRIPNTPFHCGCGKKNDVNHTLNCKLGGYVIMRHNAIRDLEADLLREVCKDVKIEPELLPIGNAEMHGNIADKARLDVSAVGFWSPMERTFVDVRIMHPNSASYRDKPPEQIYLQHEKEKKRMYNSRVLQVEKASFTPLIFSTTGGMGVECTKYHKRIAELLAVKRNENYSHVINHIRTRIRFCLLKSVLVAIRGVRGRSRRHGSMSDVSFNIIPDLRNYETI